MKAVILAGGTGKRFWPSSRASRPKQFLVLEGERSLLQQTADRLLSWLDPRSLWVSTTADLAAGVAEQLPMIPAHQILAEPEGRNTAPAIGWSIVSLPADERDEVVGIFPADHRVTDVAEFARTVRAAAEVAAAERRVMTLGVVPRWAETGYGYLELGEVLDETTGLRRVERFTEKPEPELAERFVASGDYYWNPGIFLFPGSTMLAHLERFEPEIAAGLKEVERHPERLSEIYPRLPAISIDYGVMEKLDDLATLPLDCGWSDLGSWAALAEVLPTDGEDNARRGDVVTLDARRNVLVADEGTVAVLGLDDLVVVRTADAVLVVPKERSQEVRRIVSRLEEKERDELL